MTDSPQATAPDTATEPAPPVVQAPPYPPPAALPTQEGQSGVRFDFNDGCRVNLPEGTWRVRISDLNTGNILYETVTGAGWVASAKKYYVRAKIEVWVADNLLFRHDYSAKDRDVLIQFPLGTLGDTLGWFPYAAKFQEMHGCKLTCALADWAAELFKKAYPHINFVTHDKVNPENYYATYNIGLFFTDKDHLWQPCDFRHVGLHRTAAYILGVDPTETPPRVVLDDDSRPIAEPYVCIAAQSTTQCKYWNNPTGWLDVVAFLKASGYRVICIDQSLVHGHGIVWNYIPYGAEDQTGKRSLHERVRWLKHAEFFVGLSSGLSWLAWAAGTEVVMISGFTHPTNEFTTPYRVINYHTCNSCWNDPTVLFNHQDFLWCPRHAGTPRQFECTRLITSEAVIGTIQQIPGFGRHRGSLPRPFEVVRAAVG